MLGALGSRGSVGGTHPGLDGALVEQIGPGERLGNSRYRPAKKKSFLKVKQNKHPLTLKDLYNLSKYEIEAVKSALRIYSSLKNKHF